MLLQNINNNTCTLFPCHFVFLSVHIVIHRSVDSFNLYTTNLYPCPFLIAPSCGSYHGFLDNVLMQMGKLLKQGFPVSMSQMTIAMFRLSFRSI